MILLLFLMALLALNALAWWRGADSRDGRDWTPNAVPVSMSSATATR